MKPWIIPVLLAGAGLVWLEIRRANRRQLALRVTAVMVAVASFVVLLSLRPEGRGVTLLTPGAPMAARSRDAITLAQVQSLSNASTSQSHVHMVGWGLLAHEWSPGAATVASFDPAELPVGIVGLDAPGEVEVGTPLVVRGSVHGTGSGPATILLEDPAGARDSAVLGGGERDFVLQDRPRAPGAVEYHLRLRLAGSPEVVETLGVAVRPTTMPSILVLDASPSFESATLKRWLAERGARVTIRTRISRDRYRTEALNGSPSLAALSASSLGRFDAVLADGGTLAALGPAERGALDRQVREHGLGLLVTADAPSLLAKGASGIFAGFSLEERESAGDRRLVRPVWAEAPRRSRTGIDAEPASLTSGERLVQDQAGGTVAATRAAGAGTVAITLLRSPSRWLLENEAELYSAYWYTLIGAITRDTLTRVLVSADGPPRPDHPVRITLNQPAPDSASPELAVRAPDGRIDTVALAQSPFDPGTWAGFYWPRAAGWHTAAIRGREVPFRVTSPGEWEGLEASARLAATRAQVEATVTNAERREQGALIGPLVFAALVLALTWLWVEGRRAG